MSKCQDSKDMCQQKEQKVIKDLLNFLKDDVQTIGTRLPSERKLAEQLKTSRTTLRSALKTLQAKGILEVKAGSGCFLVAKDEIENILSGNKSDSKSQISESLEAFYLFEPLAVSLATERMDNSTLKSLENCIVDLSVSMLVPDIEKIVEHHKNFHKIIIKSTGNSFIAKTLQRFELTYVLISNIMNQATIEQRNKVFALHVNIFQAIKDRDPEKAKKASEAMIRSTSTLLSQYEGIELPELIKNRVNKFLK